MAGISGIIKLLHSKHGNTFPITTTDAVYSKENGERLADSIDVISSKIGNLEELPTTEKGSVVGAVTELNNNLKNTHVGWFTLIDGADITLTATYFRLYGGRKFSDYDLLIFTLIKNNNVRNPAIFPKDRFAGNMPIEIDYSNSDETRYAIFSYTDDTTIAIRGTEGATAYVYGIKLFT